MVRRKGRHALLGYLYCFRDSWRDTGTFFSPLAHFGDATIYRMRRTYIDKPLALVIGALLIGGCLIFASAAFGLLGRGAGNITSVVANHLVLGVGLGIGLLTITTLLDYRKWRQYAPYFFALALLATALVFIPHIGAAHGGGRRWIIILGTSFQPSEALKLACVIFASAYCAAIKNQIRTFTYGFGAFAAILLLPALLLV